MSGATKANDSDATLVTDAVGTLAQFLLDTYKPEGIEIWLRSFLVSSETERRRMLLLSQADPMGT